MDLTKNELLSALEVNFGLVTLRKELKEALGDDTAVKDHNAARELFDQSYTRDELLEVAEKIFHTGKQHTYIYELADRIPGTNDITEAQIVAGLGRINTINSFTNIFRNVKFNTARTEIFGSISATTTAQVFDELTFGYTGRAQTVTSHVFFKIKFYLPYHLKIKIIKFSPQFLTVPSPTPNTAPIVLKVLKNNFQDKEIADYIASDIISPAFGTVFIASNLTTAIKILVSSQRIACIYACAELPDGSAKEEQTKNNVNGLFVSQTWHATYLLQSARIGKTKWFWLQHGTPLPQTLKKLYYHSVDTEAGLISQDLFSDESSEELENEILRNNN